MGLETTTYLSGLTASWPLAGDKKNQGDDHIRLIKATLQSTFPNADKSFRFPKVELVSSTMVLDATDQNNTIYFNTGGGNIAVTLPSGFGTSEAGWQCEIAKNSTDTNAIIVSPASGSIFSAAGTTATVRVGTLLSPCRFQWSGSAWVAIKPGPPIGSVFSFDGSTIPVGHLNLNGAAYNTTDFAELFAVLATSVLFDRRGRVDAGADGGAGRLTDAVAGFGDTHGEVGGAQSVTLSTAQIPSHLHNNGITDPGHTHASIGSHTNRLIGTANAGGGGGVYVAIQLNNGTADGITTGSASTGVQVSNALEGGGQAHLNVQPTIVTNRIIRAC